MKKVLLLCLLLLLCPAASIAHAADTMDMSTATCGDIDVTDETELLIIVTWIDGYKSAKTGDMVLDAEIIGKNAEYIAKTCSENKNFKIADFLK